MTTQVIAGTQPINMGALILAQGDQLSEASEKAIAVFKANQEQQQKTIEALTKANADLEAKLLRTQSEFAQFKATVLAQQQAHEVESQARKKKLDDIVATAEMHLGPILKHLNAKHTIDPAIQEIYSPRSYGELVSSVNEQNAYLAGVAVHGAALEQKIHQLKS
jgi:septal ring factor EnvC (AmiA/AmiB activator)